MSFDSAEFAWNSVDVRGDDGLLHNGRVTDVAAEGLVVHFGGIGHAGSELVPFGQVYHRYTPEYLRHTGKDIVHDGWQQSMPAQGPVDVLLRQQPEDRWKWYPGTLLEDLGLVSVILSDRELRGFAVQERIRVRYCESYLEYAKVEKGLFWTETIVVPTELPVSHASDDHLITVFNTHCRKQHYWMLATHALNDASDQNVRKLVSLGIFDEMKWIFGTDAGNLFLNTCEERLDKLLLSLFDSNSSSVETAPVSCATTPFPDGDIRFLYRDPSIFPQIFECLTSLQQTKLRAVCRYWNAVLTSACIRRIVSFSPPCCGRDRTRDVYRFASCMYNCWIPQAKVLVLYGGNSSDTCKGLLDKTAQLLQRIKTVKELPDVEVVLVSRDWHFDFCVTNWMSAFGQVIVSLAGVCQQVILKNTGFNVELLRSHPYKYQESMISIVVRFAHLRITRQLTANGFWTMVNNGLTDANIDDVERLTKWMRSGNTSGAERWEIAQIIHVTQTLDPRDGIHYRGMSLYDILDHVDYRQLTRFTLHALLQCFEDPYGYSIVYEL